jgi:hypothetical protein
VLFGSYQDRIGQSWGREGEGREGVKVFGLLSKNYKVVYPKCGALDICVRCYSAPMGVMILESIIIPSKAHTHDDISTR